MMIFQKLPIGVQNFEILRQENYVYVDKTESLYKLIQSGRVYFLARPRRFGKSLLMSTLDAIFQGKKALFQGLWIEKSDYIWNEYPVIWLDMSSIPNASTLFSEYLTQHLVKIAESYGLNLNPTLEPSIALQTLIGNLAQPNRKVVVLVDEYDKPLLDQINNVELAMQHRDTLKQFYGILKSQDQNLRFVMLTGVSKFSKVSIFSGLNNLEDISLSADYAELLGYTQKELEHCFHPWIQELAQTEKRSIPDTLTEIKHWYNGYRFSRDENALVYNPFSTLLLFKQKMFMSHWYATGTPTFLLNLITDKQFNAADLENLRISEAALSIEEIDQIEVLPLLYQTGYVTIKDYDKQFMSYRVGYPNWEVESSFVDALLVKFSKTNKAISDSFIFEMIPLLMHAKFDDFFAVLKRFFANIPYELHMSGEIYYQNIFYFIFTLLGLRLHAEVHTNRGRIDSVIELNDRVYIFEFKLDKTAQAALEQIKQRGYVESYAAKNKKLYLLGVNFSTTERNIESWQLEIL